MKTVLVTFSLLSAVFFNHSTAQRDFFLRNDLWVNMTEDIHADQQNGYGKMGKSFRQMNLNIYPSPFANHLTISYQHYGFSVIQIHDINGTLIREVEMMGVGENLKQLDLSREMRGIYIMSINTEAESLRLKIIRQ